MKHYRHSGLITVIAAIIPFLSACQTETGGSSGLSVTTETYNGKIERIVVAPAAPQQEQKPKADTPEPQPQTTETEKPTAVIIEPPKIDPPKVKPPKIEEPTTVVTTPPAPATPVEPQSPAAPEPTLPEVLLAPQITSHPASIVKLVGDSVAFSVKASGKQLTYQWFKDGAPINNTTPTLNISGIQRSDADNYSCMVSNAAGSKQCQPFHLYVHNPVTIIEQPGNTKAFEGESVTLSVTVDGYPEPQVDWYKDGQKLATDKSKLVINGLTAADAGSYYCIAKNKVNEIKCSSASVAVVKKTKITKQPTNQVVAAGESIAINLAATGEGALTYSCYQNGELKLQASNPNELVIEDSTPEDNGVYSCSVVSAEGSSARFAAFDVKVMVDNTRDIQVSWQPPTSRLNGAPLARKDIEKFVVHVAESIDGPFTAAASANWWESGVQISDLRLNQYYFIGITTRDVAGLESGMSTIVRIKVE